MIEKLLSLIQTESPTATLKPARRGQAAVHKICALQNAILNKADFSSITIDEKGVIQLVNLEAERMFGYTAAELTNKMTLADIIDREEVIQRAKEFGTKFASTLTSDSDMLALTVSHGIEGMCELNLIRKDGGRFSAKVTIESLSDAQNQLVGYQLIVSDETSCKQVDRCLNEKKYRILLESIGEGYCIIEKIENTLGGLDFCFIEADRAFMIQTDLKNVVGKTLSEMSPDVLMVNPLIYNSILQTGDSIKFERGQLSEGNVLEFTAHRIDDLTHHRIGITFKDITIHKRAVDRLRCSHNTFFNLIKNAAFGVYIVDAQFRLRQISIAAEKVFSNVDPLIGRDFEEILRILWPAPFASEVVRRFRHTLDTGEPYINHDTTERRENTAEVESYDWRIERIMLPDEQYGVVCYFYDITERKQAEENLRKSEERYRSLFSSMDQGFCVIEMIFDSHKKPIDYRFLEVNPAFEKQSGLHDIVGKRIREVLPNLEECWIQTFGTVALTGTPISFVREVKSLNRWIDMSAARLEGEENRNVAILFSDATEKVMGAEALRQSEARFRAVFDWGPIAMYFCDAAGVIQEVNRGARTLWGQEPRVGDTDEAFCSSLKLSFPDGTEMPYRLTPMAEVLKKEVPELTDFEIMVEQSDGSLLNIIANIVQLRNELGEITGTVNCFYDITERKQFEMNLNQAIAEAQKANLAKSDFLSSMSHELRTPLHAILGFAQLLQIGLTTPTPSQVSSIDQILKGGWYLLDLINEILDLSVIESGKVSLSLECVAVEEVMAECRSMVEPQAQKLGILVSYSPLDNSWFVRADRIRLKQVLVNLLSNAIKYNRSGGKVDVHSLCTEGKICIEIVDTGIGMCQEQLEQLFQPFNRLGRESSGVEGTGIGLIMTKRLVELMGGEMGVESTVGVGSVFWIKLMSSVSPTIVPSVQSKLIASDSATAKNFISQRKLLYVEDNQANLKFVEQLVEINSDIHLFSSADGHLSVELAREIQPAVILMDIKLPDISGIEVLKLLRQDELTAHIPVIALSANAHPRDVKDGLTAGFFRYVTKPIKVKEFLNILNEAFEYAESSRTQTSD
ncbi:PAS domain S-box protein [Candidatus Nitrotoga sp. M5]|uniref:PAS domain S-box protein n=1 Tax=Candidatus Nitrotoga sp. M5 TaxID=2890409 RepID=UPI001EF279BE|nr:PAS domain S-box protein [Candidatus Nitrotoga sp. M5]CAH1386940.1 putative Histidine kinase [Candidatus Nitrotoga sp. M5]